VQGLPPERTAPIEDSDQHRFMTGGYYLVDGGYTAV
jgi:hypothetical protein